MASEDNKEPTPSTIAQVLLVPHRCHPYRSVHDSIAVWVSRSGRALPVGTRLRVEQHGVGTYERWGKNRIGANDHFVRFASGVEKVQLKKLGAHAWDVVPDVRLRCEARLAAAHCRLAFAMGMVFRLCEDSVLADVPVECISGCASFCSTHLVLRLLMAQPTERSGAMTEVLGR